MTISRIAAVVAVVQVFLHEAGFLFQTYYATKPENPYRDTRLPRIALLGYLVTVGATTLSAYHACQWGQSTWDELILEKALAISAAVMLLEVVVLNRIVGGNFTWLIGLGLVVLVVVVEAFWRFQTVERAGRHWRELDWVAVPGWIGLWAVHRVKAAMMGEATE
ncbi:hypothetical protein EX30DRAFT_344518 [Ascodesmis nigricans]|uniref:Uncharacterized protein n=1 Tax=Ascodesmis nigricans TaxID=341454 RepID=A0A4S2MJ04_9PEZI|nr:hypothetical protein EX30DRAFT_344518 [Ascodesmis nigricans]